MDSEDRRMTDFAKEKIAFAIALLAVLFTLTPLLDTYGTVGFAILGTRLEIRHLYLVLSVTLGLAVYCYGIQFVASRLMRVASIAGDVFHAIAIVVPALYVSLYLAATLVTAVAPILRSPFVQSVVKVVVSAILGAVSVGYWNRARRILDVRQKQAEETRRADLEVDSLRMAEELFKNGHYDLATIEAFRALEIAARGSANKVDRTLRRENRDWFQVLVASLPEQLRPSLERARTVRNSAAHGVELVSEEAAREAINVIGKSLALIAGSVLDRCPACGSTQIVEESGSDHGFSWTRRRCEGCGWLDLS